VARANRPDVKIDTTCHIIHAVEELCKAGTALYDDTHPYRIEWGETQTPAVSHLLKDRTASLADHGQAVKTLRRAARYFQRNLPCMDDAEYLRPGVLEATCRRLVKDRMELLSGMRWTVAGAKAVLVWRTVNENNDWEDFHARSRTRRHREFYGSTLKLARRDLVERLVTNRM
jgi:hypothetical protein